MVETSLNNCYFNAWVTTYWPGGFYTFTLGMPSACFMLIFLNEFCFFVLVFIASRHIP